MPLLHSKLLVPELPTAFVVRPRLLKLLDAPQARLTLVCAPAGWGKTTLLSSWVRHRLDQGGPAGQDVPAWLSVEPEDNGDKFWSYVEAALAEAASRTDHPMPDPAPETGPESAREHLCGIAEALAARTRPVTLILDDLHHLDDADLVGGLDFMLRHAMGRLRLIVATRTEPSLPLHRWRLHGGLTELGSRELAFTPHETEQLLARHGVLESPERVRALHAYVEGWPGGVRLSAIRLSGPAPNATAALPDPRVAEYLLAEVIAPQPRPVRDLLVRTAVLDRFCGGLIDALAADVDSELAGAAALDRLARANSFIVAVPGEPGWYRHHRPMRDALLAELLQQAPHRVSHLHRLAAGWLRVHGRPASALAHALAARDWSGAADIVAEHWCELTMGVLGGPGMSHGPAGAAGDDPGVRAQARVATAADASGRLGLACAMHGLHRGDPDEAETLLRLVRARQAEMRERAFAEVADSGAGGAGACATMAAAVHLAVAHVRGDPERMRAAACDLLEVSLGRPAGIAPGRVAGPDHAWLDWVIWLDRVDGSDLGEGPAAAHEPVMAPVMAMALTALAAAALHRGEFDPAWATLRVAMAKTQRAGLVVLRRRNLSRFALVAAHRGELTSAWTSAAAALGIETAESTTGLEVDRAHAHVARAIVEFERGRSERAEAELGYAMRALAAGAGGAAETPGTGLERIGPAEPALCLVSAILHGALRQERGDVAGGLDFLREVRRWLDATALASRPAYDCLGIAEARLRSAGGDAYPVWRSLASGQDGRGGDGPQAQAASAVARAQAHLDDGQPSAAVRALPTWEVDIGAERSRLAVPLRIEAGLIEVLATHRLGERGRARRCLERVLGLAEPEGFRRVFLRHAAPIRPLLLAHLDTGTAHWSSVNELLEATAAPGTVIVAPADAPGPDGTRRPAEALTDRELTILRYLQSILSNVEIAGELRVSVNTVKTHVRNIYRKLEAPRRREAVRRARELRLL